ncbi:hypothetical protein [Methanococcoides alaskense]|uniref:Uncharacterized protein n=1 Tax=Methanococcoides alaskense TaxID=325778 RepID=A0AA90ZCM9_9EURY|nr:hypothetical protein [Methanococcoides alaskense]MDA0525666.1 hypothetical protein [Methanococcoides alaskense]MDR6222892.1 hypothetical protein [Methanococcoides alaskense]
MKGEQRNNGITRLTFNDAEYTFWNNADVVSPYILHFLKNEYPNSIILPEFNKVDFVVLGENLPVEIQSTVLARKKEKYALSHSYFEQMIEKQLKQNIERYEQCLFFFDSAYLDYLQTNLAKTARINMDWFYQYMKLGKLKVFTISFDGAIEETSLEQFKFIFDKSVLCKLAHDSDYQIIDRNKFKIMHALLADNEFTSDELDLLRENFKNEKMKFKSYNTWLRRKNCTERERLLSYILSSVGNLYAVNSILCCSTENMGNKEAQLRTLLILGIFENKFISNNRNICFKDKFKIAQYIPGYVRNKVNWDSLKGESMQISTFWNL